MLEQLRAKNPSLRLHAVGDPAFATFGRVINSMDVSPLLAAAHAISLPQEGSQYTASEPTFEALPIAKAIADDLFGQMPTQIGFCFGHNRFLNAVEWHTSSEINVAVTPLVLILGHTYNIQNGTLSSDKLEAFFVPAGTVIEVFATTLHFCPCEVEETGFGCVVALPKGTNTPCDTPPADKRLFRKNKWLLAHEDNAALIARGAVAGITGENYMLHY